MANISDQYKFYINKLNENINDYPIETQLKLKSIIGYELPLFLFKKIELINESMYDKLFECVKNKSNINFCSTYNQIIVDFVDSLYCEVKPFLLN